MDSALYLPRCSLTTKGKESSKGFILTNPVFLQFFHNTKVNFTLFNIIKRDVYFVNYIFEDK